MLIEKHKVRQSGDGRIRRWFSDRRFDLIVWYKGDENISGFQLCYKSGHDEKALTWFKDKGFSHDRVDDGEGNMVTHKMTPILVPDGAFDRDGILALFRNESGEIDPSVSAFVWERISAYPGNKKE